MHTFKITIFALLSSFVSNKTTKSSSPLKNKKKRYSKKNNLKEDSTDNDLSSSKENAPFYYLPVHLM